MSASTRRNARKDLDRRYALWGVGLLLAAAMPVLAGWVGLGWELSQMAGLASGLACIALCGAPVRPRDSVPPTLLSLDWHQFIGWAALVAAIVHIAGLVLVDRAVIEYLKPTTPLYQFAGIAAIVTLLILVLGSVAGCTPASLGEPPWFSGGACDSRLPGSPVDRHSRHHDRQVRQRSWSGAHCSLRSRSVRC